MYRYLRTLSSFSPAGRARRNRNTQSRRFASSASRGKVVVAMSGGVDSALSAYLLQKEGYDVSGLYMRNWSEHEEGYCSGQDDMESIDKVAKHLKIPWSVVDFQREYWNDVFEPSLEEFTSGATPNPDVLCNREIKFKRMAEYIFQHFKGTDYIATGHYARLRPNPKSGSVELLRAVDEGKDQTYFLVQVNQQVLQKTLFPVGGMMKSAVKKMAADVGLPNATRKESMGICFVGKRKFDKFLGEYLDTSKPGQFVDVDTGAAVGTHRGIPFYTIGQAASIAGKAVKYFVVSKDLQTNVIKVANSPGHPALSSTSLVTESFHWISGPREEIFTPTGLRCIFRIRHRGPLKECTVFAVDSNPAKLTVKFDSPTQAVTPGQYVALYDGEVCLGGGSILSSTPLQ
eukprot:TRINITY_DN4250_c0_g1_i2.p1 TRINITY_DN4250_c0_g1~~TRINITY_DN4250_c0_g1_i2.p1  ORF type:complete len:401 (+),score=44.21 TRINITY_DN4250_c0_g1_i2:156-1358(+)